MARSCSTPASIPNVARTSLLGLKGIGPWTADYVVMRGLSHPDVFLGSDLGVRPCRRPASPRRRRTRRAWAPWRSYAVHHLWADLAATMHRAATPPTASSAKETTP